MHFRFFLKFVLLISIFVFTASPFVACNNSQNGGSGGGGGGGGGLANLNFAIAISFGVNNLPFPATKTKMIATGDFNGDGKIDIVGMQDSNNGLSLLLNQGGSLINFNLVAVASMWDDPQAIVASDFDGDGIIDVALVNGAAGMTPGVISLKWNGATLAPTVTAFNTNTTDLKGIAKAGNFIVVDAEGEIATLAFSDFGGTNKFNVLMDANITTPQHMASGDLNGDGKTDVVFVVDDGTMTGNDAFFFWMANADGTFSTAGLRGKISAGTQGDIRGIGTADLNKDGKDDVVLGAANNNELIVLLSNGDGTFSAPQFYPTPAGSTDASGVAFADFNLDGNIDVAVADFANSNLSNMQGSVSVFLGNGDGTLQTPVNFAAGLYQGGTLGNEPRDVATGDFNGDGKPDISLANSNNASGADTSISVLLNTSF